MKKYFAILSLLLFFVPLVSAQTEWENAINSLRENVEREINELRDLIENLRNYLQQGGEKTSLSVFLITGEGMKQIYSFSFPLFPIENYSPSVVTVENAFLTLYILKATQPANGVIKLTPIFSGTWLPFVQSFTLFSYPFTSGIAFVPLFTSLSDMWVVNITSEDAENFVFFVKVGKKVETSSSEERIYITTVGYLVRGQYGTIRVMRGNTIATDVLLELDDGTTGNGYVTFLVPNRSSIFAVAKKNGEVVASATFQIFEPQTSSKEEGFPIKMAIIILPIIAVVGFYLYRYWQQRQIKIPR